MYPPAGKLMLSLCSSAFKTPDNTRSPESFSPTPTGIEHRRIYYGSQHTPPPSTCGLSAASWARWWWERRSSPASPRPICCCALLLYWALPQKKLGQMASSRPSWCACASQHLEVAAAAVVVVGVAIRSARCETYKKNHMGEVYHLTHLFMTF